MKSTLHAKGILFSLIVLLILANIIGLKATHLTLDLGFSARYVVWIGAFFLLPWLCAKMEFDRRIVGLLYLEGYTLLLMALCAVLSYIVLCFHQPFIDRTLAEFDQTLGFDWLSFFAWTNAHPLAKAALQLSYISFQPQMITLTFILGVRGAFGRAWELLWAFLVSCLICIVFEALVPAVGPFYYYHALLGEPFVAEILSVHAGTVNVIGKTPVLGLIEFPSFHVALAVIYTYATRGMRIFFPTFLLLNLVMIVATLPIGGHYLADLPSGGAVAVLSIYIVRRFLVRPEEARLETVRDQPA